MSLLDVQTVPVCSRCAGVSLGPEPLDMSATVAAQIASVQDLLKPNARVAVTVGSRDCKFTGNCPDRTDVKGAGVQPLSCRPWAAMAAPRPRGKADSADYGITEETMKVPIEAAMTTREVGRTVDGVPAFTSTTALAADGIVVLNRVKPTPIILAARWVAA